ncbi:MAG: T9SS type A sorting domain-containing protein [Ignavibacteria bacterium]|nr:T9SS type A sorting domain-containing protein [Ignavibacteria bacterium]
MSKLFIICILFSLIISHTTMNAGDLKINQSKFNQLLDQKSKIEKIKSSLTQKLASPKNLKLTTSNYFLNQTFSAREKLDTIRQIANSYASNSQLRAILFNEMIDLSTGDDTVDGKAPIITYYFFSNTKGFFSIYYSQYFVFIDTAISNLPFTKANANLNFDFVDSDVVSDSAELNGGTAFRYEPGGRTFVIYELRNYSTEDLFPPDTVNPYWKVSYLKTDFANNPQSILNFYINPYNGRIISKMRLTFEPFTIKQKFPLADSVAKLRYPNSSLMYALGFEDSYVDGKSIFSVFGYLSPNNKKFNVNIFFGVPAIDDTSGWLFDDFVLNKSVPLLSYRDSDSLMLVSEAHGGTNFRDSFYVESIGFLYCQSPFDTSRVLFHGIYNGIDTTSGYYKNLINIIDPVTGVLIQSLLLKNEDLPNVPEKITLYQNYPNPFNASTKIRYILPKSSVVSFKIIDIMGRVLKEIKVGYQKAGAYELQLNLDELSSGTYIYSLQTDYSITSKKMILIK